MDVERSLSVLRAWRERVGEEVADGVLRSAASGDVACQALIQRETSIEPESVGLSVAGTRR
jgi:hypothetical protein